MGGGFRFVLPDLPESDRAFTCSEAPGVHSFDSMVEANADDDEMVELLRSLRAGEARRLDLGAGGIAEIARVA